MSVHSTFRMVRCSSISPLTSIVENCANKEILERVYTQIQSFLSDPILKDDYFLQIELLKTFRRISTRCNSKFREECKLAERFLVNIIRIFVDVLLFLSHFALFDHCDHANKERDKRERLRVHILVV